VSMYDYCEYMCKALVSVYDDIHMRGKGVVPYECTRQPPHEEAVRASLDIVEWTGQGSAYPDGLTGGDGLGNALSARPPWVGIRGKSGVEQEPAPTRDQPNAKINEASALAIRPQQYRERAACLFCVCLHPINLPRTDLVSSHSSWVQPPCRLR
jgi:hypothetical protein